VKIEVKAVGELECYQSVTLADEFLNDEVEVSITAAQ